MACHLDGLGVPGSSGEGKVSSSEQEVGNKDEERTFLYCIAEELVLSRSPGSAFSTKHAHTGGV